MRRATAVGLIVALAAPPLFVIIPDRLLPGPRSLPAQIVLQALFCGLAAAIVAIVVRWERVPLRTIGLRKPDARTLVSALLLWVCVYLTSLMTAPLVNAAGTAHVEIAVSGLLALPVWLRVIVGATAGVVEETLYRGYAIERLAAITGRTWLAASISAGAFAVAHIPLWGVGFALAADLPFGIVMTLFYVWRRDLAANIAVHSGSLVVAMLTLAR